MEADRTAQNKGRYAYGIIAGLVVGTALWLFTVKMLILVR